MSGLWKYAVMTAAVPLVMLTGCDLLKKKKKEESSEPTPVTMTTKKDIPDKAFIIGKGRLVRTPKSGGFPPQTVYKMKRQAFVSAKKRARAKFKRKYPGIRCIHEIKIGERTDLSHYELRVTKRRGRSYNYYVYKMAWTDVKCVAKGRMAGTTGTHLFMLENPKSDLLK
jgi:hypothetical protein